MTQPKNFSSTTLPSFVPGSGAIAVPKPGAPVAYVVAPAKTQIKRPASWGAGQDLGIDPGVIHIAQDAEGDSYPNMEFATFYEDSGPLEAADPRATFLIAFWKERGHDVTPRLAQKTRPAVMLGTVAPECTGGKFVNHEGESDLLEGNVILQSPDDPNVRWTVTAKVFSKKYDLKKN